MTDATQEARALSRRGRRAIGRGWVIATYVALAFFVLWTVVPFVWMFLASIKTNKEIYQEFTILPKQVYFGHYQELLGGKFGVWLRNSTIVSLTVTSLSIVLGSFAAYAVTRLQFAGRGVMARGLIFTYLVPGSLLFIPLFQLVATVDLVDTLSALVLVYPSFTLPFCTWMLVSYFRSIPAELEEAALIDGCGRLGVLFRITIPLSAPAIAVVALFSFTQSWNEFLYALVFTSSIATRTVTVGLTQMLGEDVFYWGQMMGGAIIAALPPVILYTFAQRLVIRGLVGGAVKG
ncbi:MAG: carbohydrate ABC transporter permease [Chloroflexota bacterium]|nr:MAG: carbohydrate ABC transporter permease [Chloroflexota bacterium]